MTRNEEVDLAPETSYVRFLEEVKARIRQARRKASLAVNRELICLYWHIGRLITERQASEGWVSKATTNLEIGAGASCERPSYRLDLQWCRTRNALAKSSLPALFIILDIDGIGICSPPDKPFGPLGGVIFSART